MHFIAVAALLALSASALPARQIDNGVLARNPSPEAIAEALAQSAHLNARDKEINWGAQPSGSAKCPATARYSEHTFTENQIKVAFLAGAKLNAADKQLGDRGCLNFLFVEAADTEFRQLPPLFLFQPGFP